MRVLLGAMLVAGLIGQAVAQEGGMQAPAPEAAVPAPSPSPAEGANAAEPNAGGEVETLTGCLVQHSAQPESDAMKRVMVAALSDDTPGLKGALSEFSGLLLKLSMSSCGVGLSQLQDPAYAATFQQASSKYGAVLGAKLMEEAFAKLN